MLIELSDDEDGDENIEGGLCDAAKHPLVKLKEGEEEAKLSLNIISGVLKPPTMWLKAQIGKYEVFLLVDSGLTYNFINTDIMRRLGLKGEVMESFKVRVANKDELKSEELICTRSLNQHHSIRFTFSVVGCDLRQCMIEKFR